MGTNIHDLLVLIKGAEVTESVCGFVAICMTLLRLWIRRTRYWWDDAWALFSLLCLFVQIGTVFTYVGHPSELSRLSRVVVYYLMASTFYMVIWTARISILFSIIHIDPNPFMRQRLKWLAAVFVGANIFFLAQLIWTCENSHNDWKDTASSQCRLQKQVPICQLVFVTTIVSLVHAAFIISEGGFPELISALVEDCMSLTVPAFLSSRRPYSAASLAPIREMRMTTTMASAGHYHSSSARRQHARLALPRAGPPASGSAGAGVSSGNTTESATLDATMKTLPAYPVDALGPDEMSAGAKTDKELDENAKKGMDGGVVRIDVLPYPRQPPPSET
ncbi:hypothetical protein BJV78DRAFT_1157041 [Lactifluus subvellereus]|nr:hypothetical protein BJV78DRAFT_1157041 [Lactifluus subvellereus]